MDKNIILTIVLIISMFLILKTIKYFLNKIGLIKKVTNKRIYYISTIIYIFIIIISLFVLAVIWSVSLDGILIFGSSMFAVIGVALFAQWSILSNLTSSIIIFFTFPARVGDKIMIIDSDNSVSGEITEISLFQITLLDDDANIIIYPNNLFIQKPIKQIKN